MKLKKWMLGLITFAAMVVLCVVCAGAETYGDFQYSVLDDGTVEITDYNGSAETVDIPEMIDGKSVTRIGKWAFSYCKSVKSITIPDSVTSIDYDAFDGCTSLVSVTIPDSVTSISNRAFIDCTSLVSITIPNSVTSIGSDAFSNTALLENQTTTIKYVDKWVIECDNAVSSVTIKNGTVGIADSAFSGCTSLTSVTIPDSVTSIGGSAFSGCTSLTSITIPNSVTEIEDRTFGGCESLKSITIPNSVTSIGGDAFYDCRSLTSITIPNSVTSISYATFYGCISLTTINVATKNQNYVSVNGVLFNKDKTTIMCYPAGKKDKNYLIPDGVTSIEDAFRNCTSLTSVTMPDSIENIRSAFYGCVNLTNVTISKSVKSIGWDAFRECKSLTSITIPDTVTVIGTCAFRGCISLTDVKMSNSIQHIGDWAFNGCESLTNITIPNSVTVIWDSVFGGCTSLKSITIPKSVEEIFNWAFGYYYDNDHKKIDNFKIYCYSGTAGEEYAKENGFDYVLLDKLPTLTKVTGFKLGGRAADALRINWTKNASADGYIVEMYKGGKWTRVAKITNNSTTTFRKAGLNAGTVYKFRVKAYKMYDITADYGEYSATVTARTNPSVIKGAKLGGRAADALRINWTKNTSADGYIVEMYQGNKWIRVAKITNSNTTTFRKAGLKASTVYKFRVRAYKMSGSTALYGNYSATVTARTNPSTVNGVKIAGKAKDALRLSWTKNTSAQGYIVEMYKGGKWVRAAKITKNTTVTYRISRLAKNTTYKIRIKAYKMSGSTVLYSGYTTISGKTTA